MSWCIKSIGPRAAVKAAVLANNNIPSGAKSAIVEILDEPVRDDCYTSDGKQGSNTFARVDGYGHANGGCPGSIGKLEVELFVPAGLPEAIGMTGAHGVIGAGSGYGTGSTSAC